MHECILYVQRPICTHTNADVCVCVYVCVYVRVCARVCVCDLEVEVAE